MFLFQLLDFIRHLDPNDKAIVFVGRKLVADQVASELSLIGISCQCIHGDREQADREQVSWLNISQTVSSDFCKTILF